MSEKPNSKENYVENDLKIVYDIIAYHYKHLIKLRKEQKDINKKNIFEIVQNNEGINTREIHDILEENTKRYNLKVMQEAQKLYDLGNINSSKEKEVYIKKNIQKTIVMRTIQLIVKELHTDKMILNKNRRFYINRNPKIDNPYINEKYVKRIIEQIFNTSNFQSDKQFTQDLVNKFGLILVFNFIIAFQDIKENNKEKEANLFDENKEISWLKNVISIDDMYNQFTKVIKSYEIYDKFKSDTQLTTKLMNIIKHEYPIIYSSLLGLKSLLIDKG